MALFGSGGYYTGGLSDGYTGGLRNNEDQRRRRDTRYDQQREGQQRYASTAWGDQRSHAATAADAAQIATAAARAATRAAAAAAASSPTARDVSRYERYPATDYDDRDLRARYTTDRYGTREQAHPRSRGHRSERERSRDYSRSGRDYADGGNPGEEYSSAVGNIDRGFSVRVMVISSNLTDEMVLMRAVHDNCALVIYDYNRETLSGLLRRVEQVLNGTRADSIALIDHGRPSEFCLLRGIKVNADTLTSQRLRSFFQDLGSLIKTNGRLDLLSCSLAQHGDMSLLSPLEQLVQRDIAASDDLTGHGGDFELEVGGDHGTVHASRLYFDTNLLRLWTESAACTAVEKKEYDDFFDNC